MKFNQWTLTLAAAGVVSLASVTQAEEAKNQMLTALSSTTLSGYVDTSVIWRPGTGNAAGAGVYTGGAKHDGFNLNVVKLSLEKPLDEGQWSAGYRVDLLFGPDANTFKAINADGNASDIAIQQAYVNLRAPVGNGLDFKMGVFDSIIGYESFDSYKNPNYSRSYGYAIEPHQHTGLLATYQVSEIIGLAAGIANTSVSPINGRSFSSGGVVAESRKTYMGGITLTAPESLGFLAGSTVYAGVVDGFNWLNGAGSSDQVNYYVGGTFKTPVENLAVGLCYDYAGASTKKFADNTPRFRSAYANATALYLSYQATEKLKLGLRGEYATWTSNDASKNIDEVLAGTATIDYALWANVITRLEARWDHDLSARDKGESFFDNRSGKFGLKNLCTLALNVIYKF